MRKYATIGKSVAPKKQASSVATSSTSPTTSKSPPCAAQKNLNRNPPRVELKPNKCKKRTDLKTGRYKTQRTRQGIVSIKFLSEELVRFAWLIDVQRDLIGDSDAVTFQSYHLLRVIR